MKTIRLSLGLLLTVLAAATLPAQVPQLINYQGRLTVGGANFTGTGQFKFALVNTNGSTSYWSNDGSSVAGSEPTAAVSLSVGNGVYSLLLGDTSLTNMTAVPATVFANSDVRLRVWFNDGVHSSQLLTPDQRIAAVGYALVASSVPDGSITAAKLASGAVASALGSGSITGAQLAAGAAAANLAASGQAGVPSGGVVLSGNYADANLLAAGYVKLGSSLLADGWVQGSSPGVLYPNDTRALHTAVWTGTEMIVWGGDNGTNVLGTGARYSPATNTWTATTATGAPSAREFHTAVWTGTVMIIWGGYNGTSTLWDGARYDPASDTWSAVTTTGVSYPRQNHTAVWTGTAMVIWGGSINNNVNSCIGNGARYNPATDSWAAISTTSEPAGRRYHTAVWTGADMIVWGGTNGLVIGDGGIYHAGLDQWVSIPVGPGSPISRTGHSAVWTGSAMVVWGGLNAGTYLGDGGAYYPGQGWAQIPAGSPNAPGIRQNHTAVWTGTEMIIWGGYNGFLGTLADGARFNPAAGTWAPLSATNAPAARQNHTAVWTGTEMLVWGGLAGSTYMNDLYRYSPARSVYLYQRP